MSLPKTRPDGAPLTVKPEHFDLRSHDRPPMEVDELPKEKKNPSPKQQSKLQRQLYVDNLVDKVLGTATTVTLCELLGTSPTASKKIQDYLCVTQPTQHISENVNSLEKSYLLHHNKPVMLNPKTNHPTYNPLDTHLVNLTVQFKNGHVANALIDPGSELDIMGHETWLQTSEPVDRCVNTLMQDASNHVTNL